MTSVRSTAAVLAPAATAAWSAPARPGYDGSATDTERRVAPMLDAERVVWLSTVRPDGLPHLVPTWFWWDGEALVVFSKPGAVKVRNLRANPRLMVALGNPDDDFAVGLIEAAAEVADAPAAVPDAFLAKYASDLAAGGLDAATYRATYTQVIRIVPTRYLAWHGRGAAPVPVTGAVVPSSAPARRIGVPSVTWLVNAARALGRAFGADRVATGPVAA